jgi:hypothetical protein
MTTGDGIESKVVDITSDCGLTISGDAIKGDKITITGAAIGTAIKKVALTLNPDATGAAVLAGNLWDANSTFELTRDTTGESFSVSPSGIITDTAVYGIDNDSVKDVKKIVVTGAAVTSGTAFTSGESITASPTAIKISTPSDFVKAATVSAITAEGVNSVTVSAVLSLAGITSGDAVVWKVSSGAAVTTYEALSAVGLATNEGVTVASGQSIVVKSESIASAYMEVPVTITTKSAFIEATSADAVTFNNSGNNWSAGSGSTLTITGCGILEDAIGEDAFEVVLGKSSHADAAYVDGTKTEETPANTSSDSAITTPASTPAITSAGFAVNLSAAKNAATNTNSSDETEGTSTSYAMYAVIKANDANTTSPYSIALNRTGASTAVATTTFALTSEAANYVYVVFGKASTEASDAEESSDTVLYVDASNLKADSYTFTLTDAANKTTVTSSAIDIGSVALDPTQDGYPKYGVVGTTTTLPAITSADSSKGTFMGWKLSSGSALYKADTASSTGTAFKFTKEDVTLKALYTSIEGLEVKDDVKAEATVAAIEDATEAALASSVAAVFAEKSTAVAISGLDKIVGGIIDDLNDNSSINSSIDAITTDSGILEGVSTLNTLLVPVMNVKVTAVTSSGSALIKNFTVDITPEYQVYVTSESAVEKIDTDTTSGNAISVGKIDISNKLKGVEVSVSIPLPSEFTSTLGNNQTIYVKHTHDGIKYSYKGEKDNNNILTFKNKNGFSDFEIGVDGPVATVNGTDYADFASAVSEVSSGGSIVINSKPEEDDKATISSPTAFTISTGAMDTTAGAIVKNNITLADGLTGELSDSPNDDGSYTYTVTGTVTTPADSDDKKGSTNPGGGGSSSSSSKVSVPTKIDGGSISVSSRNPSKGDTVTITAKPNDGYKVDKITVTDKNGKTVEVTDAGDNKYTFVMPDTTVSISASFAKDDTATDENNNTNNPSDTSGIAFTDVSTGDYYYDAVKWAVDNNVTNGLSATSFGPSASCTRAQTVTFMWRAAGSPAPQSVTNPFTDVAQGSYYYDAVMWAVEQGITTGATATTFAPDATVTRAQFVTFEYRAAGSPEVTSDVSFGDVSGNAYYANAVKWAAANGITTGTSANAFSPAASCTRGQTVTFLYRYYAA